MPDVGWLYTYTLKFVQIETAKGFLIGVESYNILVSNLAVTGNVKQVDGLTKEMLKKGIRFITV